MAEPESCASLIMDGMDQAKFRCPRNLPAAKAMADLDRPSLHLSGTLIHGLEERYMFSDADIKKDPNTECELLMDALIRIQTHSVETDSEFPKNIFIQADNCPREMKNQFSLLWGGAILLLSPRILTITFNFLRVGHTHEDIGALGMFRFHQTLSN